MNYIDDILYELFKESLQYQTVSERYIKQNALDAITWYINTGRAPTQWIRALQKASPSKLMNRIMRNKDHSTDNDIRTVTNYLKQYCGY